MIFATTVQESDTTMLSYALLPVTKKYNAFLKSAANLIIKHEY
jgi:hypothetical protein